MIKENTYPIKYAILELKENGNYVTNYEDIVRGYIVSKCWVVASSLKYFSNGDSKLFHKVIFPYKNLDRFKMSLLNNEKNLGERIEPQYDFNYNPYPVDITEELFDSYEEAKEKAHKKNEEMKHKLVLNVRYSILDSRFKIALSEMEKEFLKELSICELFESLALLNTEDMELTPNNPREDLKLLRKKNCEEV